MTHPAVTHSLKHPNIKALIHDFPKGDEYMRAHDPSMIPERWREMVRDYDSAMIPAIFSKPQKEYEQLDWEVANANILQLLSQDIEVLARTNGGVKERHIVRLKNRHDLKMKVDSFIPPDAFSSKEQRAKPMTYKVARENEQSMMAKWSGTYQHVREEWTLDGKTMLSNTVLDEREISLVKDFPIIPRLMNVLTDGISEDCHEPHMIISGNAKTISLVMEGKLSGNVRTERNEKENQTSTFLYVRRSQCDLNSKDHYVAIHQKPHESALVSIGPLKEVPLAILMKAMGHFYDISSDEDIIRVCTGKEPTPEIERMFAPTLQRLYSTKRDMFYMKANKSARMRKESDVNTSEEALDAIISPNSLFFNQINYGCPNGIDETEWRREKVMERLRCPIPINNFVFEGGLEKSSTTWEYHSFLAFVRVVQHHFHVIMGDAPVMQRDNPTNIELRGIGRFLTDMCIMEIKERVRYVNDKARKEQMNMSQLLERLDSKPSTITPFINKGDASYSENHSIFHNANRSGDWYKVTRREKHVSDSVRNDDPENVGYFDSAGTTDGEKVGLVQNLTASAQLSIALSASEITMAVRTHLKDSGVDGFEVSKDEKDYGFVLFDAEAKTDLGSEIIRNRDGWTLLVGSDARIFGGTRSPLRLMKKLRSLKQKGELHIMLGIAYLPEHQEIRLNYQDGRLLRPLLYVNDDGMPNLTPSELDKLRQSSPRIVRWLMMNPSKGSLFDPYELRNELVAPDVSYLCQNSELMKAYVSGPVDSMDHILLRRHFGLQENAKGDRLHLGHRYTLMECTTSFNRSRKLSMVPLLNCILPARHVFLNSHLNQAIQESIDPYKEFLVTPQNPERARVVSYVSAMANLREEQLGYGHNVNMAMLDFMGEGCEDGVIVSKSYAERASITVQETHKSYLRTIDKRDEIHCMPRAEEVRHGLPYRNIDSLDSTTGTVRVGDEVENGDVLQLKMLMTTRDDSNDGIYRYEESDSLIYKGAYPAVVTSVETRFSNRFNRMGVFIEIKTQAKRNAEKGDKLSLERCGQKATISAIMDDVKMPRDSWGNQIDIVMCPFSLPTRMTASLMHTMISGKISSTRERLTGKFERIPLGPYFDVDAVMAENAQLIERCEKEGLLQKGDVLPDGTEWLYDGFTGKRLQNRCMTGTVYVMRLMHFSAKKAGCRAEGAMGKNWQPIQGIGGNKGGGNRIGEMEFSALASHSVPYIIQERISDYRQIHVCARCGRLAQVNPETRQWYCSHCPVNTRIAKCHFTYAMLTVMWALAGCQMEMRFMPNMLD